MKILSEQKTKDSKFPIRTNCDWCEVELEVEEDDVTVGEYGLYQYTCPCCKKQSTLDDGIDITIDNVEFPTHFYNFEGGVRIPNDRITSWIKEGINYLRENKDEDWWSTSTGDSIVFVKRYDGDEMYSVNVAKNYYETDIPFEEKDYR